MINNDHMTYQALPFPMERQVTIQGGRLASRKHTIYALIEVDVTEPRRMIHEHKVCTGETFSFTAFVIACLGKAIEQNIRMHAYRDWRNRLIVFDEVDVNTMIEVEAEGRKRVIPHWIRAANKRTFKDIHGELRSTKAKPEQTREFGVKWLGLLPTFAWDVFFWFIFKNPHWLKKSFGTVGMT